MKKTLLIAILSFALIISFFPRSSFAKDNTTKNDDLTSISKTVKSDYTNEELDAKLRKAGTPEEVLKDMNEEEKRTIVENSNGKLKFGGVSKADFAKNSLTGKFEKINDNNDGTIKPMGILYPSAMSLKLYFYYGSSYDQLLGHYHWNVGPNQSIAGVAEDQVGIVVPDGWEIQSTGYICKWRKSTSSSFSTAGCGSSGQPTHYSLYGATWQFGGQVYPVIASGFDGYCGYNLKKKDPYAINRAILKYNEAISGAGGYSVSVAFKSLSVTFNSSEGSNNTGEIDLSW